MRERLGGASPHSELSSIIVRVARSDDVNGLARLRREWTEEDLGVLEDPEFEYWFTQWWAAAGRIAFVVEHSGSLIGMINMAIIERMPRPGRRHSQWAYFGNAFVLPTHRDRGVGRRLLNAALDHAQELGCVRVVLAPTARSRTLYRRAGFQDADLLLVHPLDG